VRRKKTTKTSHDFLPASKPERASKPPL